MLSFQLQRINFLTPKDSRKYRNSENLQACVRIYGQASFQPAFILSISSPCMTPKTQRLSSDFWPQFIIYHIMKRKSSQKDPTCTKVPLPKDIKFAVVRDSSLELDLKPFLKVEQADLGSALKLTKNQLNSVSLCCQTSQTQLKQLILRNLLKQVAEDEITHFSYTQVSHLPVNLVLKYLFLNITLFSQKLLSIAITFPDALQQQIGKRIQLPEVRQFRTPELREFRLMMRHYKFEPQSELLLGKLLKNLRQTSKLQRLHLDLESCQFMKPGRITRHVKIIVLNNRSTLEEVSINLGGCFEWAEFFEDAKFELPALRAATLGLKRVSLKRTHAEDLIRFLRQPRLRWIQLDLASTLIASGLVEQLLHELPEELLGLEVSLNQWILRGGGEEEQRWEEQRQEGACAEYSLSLCNSIVHSGWGRVIPFREVRQLSLCFNNTRINLRQLQSLTTHLQPLNIKVLNLEQFSYKYPSLTNVRLTDQSLVGWGRTLVGLRQLVRLDLTLFFNNLSKHGYHLFLGNLVQLNLLYLYVNFEFKQRTQLVDDYAISNEYFLDSNLVVGETALRLLRHRRGVLNLLQRFEGHALLADLLALLNPNNQFSRKSGQCYL